TGTPRRFPLWPETREAVEAVAAVRLQPKDPAHADRVFLTRLRQPWVRFNGDEKSKRSCIDSVTRQFTKLAAACNVKLTGGFYVLRHVHRTVSDETRDRPAIDLVMGHSDGSMAGHYGETIADERLQAVVDHVRGWLLKGRETTEAKNVLP